MRNAALTLGIIAGVIGMIVGFFGYGYTELASRMGEVEEMFGMFDDPQTVRIVSFLAPMLAIAGGAMAKARALWGGVLLLASAAAMYHAFGFNVFTMFPIGFAALGGVLALAAGKPDEPKAHF
ncbi:hypothetical protein [Mameliella sediminis]|uniref:hypothetical protein n=1 Tax=Mameliella sediminis TaxID=2836866 RepID=UPI001C490D35|nr:hypothetical protein [Mameliella sediminis]MBY6115877.1 hypothetical protein [Antarctobacter heliothermus]MBY6145345.1 hypothetical protein [Mameliella alba]MBV7393931.1 hypothetical protein [Mameliella sediminis]MBY6162155.1 hypothetical protein [Mameliella alba]MBY6170625.1 hypothetical protein [Mameliella alba]